MNWVLLGLAALLAGAIPFLLRALLVRYARYRVRRRAKREVAELGIETVLVAIEEDQRRLAAEEKDLLDHAGRYAAANLGLLQTEIHRRMNELAYYRLQALAAAGRSSD